ncbi:cytidylyltransferase domain-containing protein [Christiangramia sediminis]|uniref:N-acylneuraminate cytidylyltransferase n=1 Tax=Christiangramia sediminis TaxID=2881336 RepID=A0A9X1RWX4_9FLAO|nr:hypothetical protein [Christiangramia sediminis]MCB7480619.1 hypothetical protein [Christiangramia sediminis]
MSIAVFLPTRKGSERVKNKNTRKFSGYDGGLLELKLKQLSTLNVDEVILSTNDEQSIEIAKKIMPVFPRLKIDIRPDFLASSNTNLSDLIKYAADLTTSDNILWTHVTSPMVSTSVYKDCIKTYINALNNGYDSLMSVTTIQNFLWDIQSNDIINRIGDERWPKTQNLKKIYELNSAVFISPIEIYRTKIDRVGANPYLYEMDKITSVDVDWKRDFKLAEAIFQSFNQEKFED